MGRGALVGIPTWLLLLLLMPLSGMGPLPCLVAASVLTACVVIWAGRRRERRVGAQGVEDPGGPPARRQMTPLAAAGLTLGAVALLGYVVLVIRAA